MRRPTDPATVPSSRLGFRRLLGAATVYAVLVVLLNTGASYGSPTSSTNVLSGPGSKGPTSALVQVAPGFDAPIGASYLGRLANSTPLAVDVALGPASLVSLENIAQAVSTPGAPSYHHFLTPAQVADEFGASPTSIASAATYFAAFGLTVVPSPDRFLLRVTGSSGGLGAAFHTEFDRYRVGGRTVFTHTLPASLPSGLPWYGAVGLGNLTNIHPMAQAFPSGAIRGSAANCTVSGPLPPCAFWNAYDYSGLLAGGTNGTGVHVGIVDGYDSSEPQPLLSSDFASFAKAFALPGGNVQIAYPVPAGNSLNTSASDLWADEEALDLEWARATAPGDAITIALTAPTNAAIYGAVDWFVAQDSVQVLSLSWGEPDVGVFNSVTTPCSSACNASSDGSYGLLHPVLAAAAAEGISVFVASGDCGAAGGTNGVSTNYPSSDPWATGVGGTSLNVNANGGYVNEVAWSGNASGATGSGCVNQGGSGGGWSPFPRPSWQAGTGLPSKPDLRGAPDVALDAETGVPIVFDHGTYLVIGTSVGTPSWAGMTAVMDQAIRGREGFLNPALYAILRNGSYSTAFHDIISGSNGYAAGIGWDPVTGIGTPDVARLIPALSRTPFGVSDLFARITADRTTGAVPLNVTFTARVSGGASPYSWYDFTFGDGNASPTLGPTTTHEYRRAGVFNATVTVFDAAGNSTLSAPVIVLVGGGTPLAVTLTASTSGGPVGTPVLFQVSVAGGTAPYTYQIWFGDGTYSIPGSVSSVTHTYRNAGGYCALAMASDSARPIDAGGSLPVSVAIGTPFRPVCAPGPPVFANLTSARVSADLPGDLPLRWNASGGVGPLTTWIDSADPYSTLCQCGVFRTVGTVTLTLYANDSLGNVTTRTLSVTLYPRLSATFLSAPTSGAAPLSVRFSQTSHTGGHGVDPNRTSWSVDGGTPVLGQNPVLNFSTPGEHSVLADLQDTAGGNASELMVVDVTTGSGNPLGVTATISPGTFAGLGAPMTFNATATGGSGSYTYLWNLSDGTSAFGPSVTESPAPPSCASLGTRCMLNVSLTVRDSTGARLIVQPALGAFFGGLWSAITPSVTWGGRGGSTPLPWTSTVTASGLPGITTNWSLGDGTAITGASVRHAFLRPGNFTAVATVGDAGGDHWQLDQAVAVTGAVIPPPSVRILPNLTRCFTPCSLNLSANATGGVPPFSFNWSFGDGTNGTGRSVLHAFPDHGRFNVTVNATDTFGDVVTARMSVTVYHPTPVQLTAYSSRSTVPAGGSFPLEVSGYPLCVAYTVPECANEPIAVELEVRLNNSSGAPELIRPIGPLTANVSVPVSFAAPPLQGGFWLAAVAQAPNFTGVVVLHLNVGPPVPSSPSRFALALIFLGVGAGVIVAALAVIYERSRSRRQTPPPEPAPPTTPVSP
ncbi:MAG TPA: PKD domain-containing protein [Thermoplasmata archaeon]|nr:PKD domain-containing protein [Thermoplasmata archaeon]